MSFTVAHLVVSLEFALAIAGAVLLWRLVLSPAARVQRHAPLLAPWNAPATEFLIFVIFVLAGAFLASLATSAAAKSLGLRGDAATVVSGAGAQLGMLIGVLYYRSRAGRPPSPARRTNIFISGATTFLVSLPILIVAAKAWELLLGACGLPTERQDLIGMFANAESPGLLAVMITLAVIIAPVTEELVFRAGLFRFFRGVLPRWFALLGPGLFFASLHVNWSTLQGLTSLVPLTVLAIMFSLAYERTGQIGTSIVAHALFNLNTVVLIFSGVGA